MACWRVVPDGIILSVRLTPRTARDVIEGIGRLSDGREIAIVRVRAVPADGRANAALLMLLADAFSVPKSSVAIVYGRTARLKEVRISGDIERLAAIASQFRRA